MSLLQQELDVVVEETVARVTKANNEVYRLIASDEPFSQSVLHPEKGALANIGAIYETKYSQGKGTVIAQGGPPASGKTSGAHRIATVVGDRIHTRTGRDEKVYIVQGDTTMWERGLRDEGMQGKWDWARQAEFVRDLSENGRAVVVPTFDDISSGNPIITGNDDTVTIFSGNRTIVIRYTQRDAWFTFDHTLENPDEPNVDLAKKWNKKHTSDKRYSDTEIFPSGSSKYRIYIANGQLVIGMQNLLVMQRVNGEYKFINELTYHVVDQKKKKVHVQLPKGHEYLENKTTFALREVSKIEVDKSRSNLKEARFAQMVNFIPAGSAVVLDAHMAFVNLNKESGQLVWKDSRVYDVRINYRVPRLIRWVRDMLRAVERGRTYEQIINDMGRFWLRAYSEEIFSVPAGSQEGIVQVDVTTPIEAIGASILDGEEHFDTQSKLLSQLGIDAPTIDAELRKEIDAPVIRRLVAQWIKDGTEGTIKQVDGMPDDGIVEYEVGDFVLRFTQGQRTLSREAIEQNKKITARGRRVVAPNSLVDLSPLGPQFNGAEVSVWNKAPSASCQLTELANQIEKLRETSAPNTAVEALFEEAHRIINRFVDKENQLHRRGIVDKNPSLQYRRLLPEDGEINPFVVSPEVNLLMGVEALRFYEENYDPEQTTSIYLRHDLVNQVPEIFQEYYRKRVGESLGKTNLSSFFLDAQGFEGDLPAALRTPFEDLTDNKNDLPGDIRKRATRKADVKRPLIATRVPPVESAKIVEGRLNHLSYPFDRWFMDRLKQDYFTSIPPNNSSPQLTWTNLFLKTYPNRYARSFRLISIFHKRLVATPHLLERWEYQNNAVILDLLQELYRDEPFEQSSVLNNPYMLRSVNRFITHTRVLPTDWDTPGKVQNFDEFTRLLDMMSQDNHAVLPDVDGTLGNYDYDSAEVLPEFKQVHEAIVAFLADLTNQGVTVLPNTNRREWKALKYAREIAHHQNATIRATNSGSNLELYHDAGTRGINMEDESPIEEFTLTFPSDQKATIVQRLRDKGINSVEILEGKINVRMKGEGSHEHREQAIDRVSTALKELGILAVNGETVYDLQDPYKPVAIVDAGAGIISILPAAAGKGRAKEFIMKRHGLTSRQILILVDKAGRRGNDESLGEGITVGLDEPFQPEFVSTKKALGQTGPKQSLWVLQNSFFVRPNDETIKNRGQAMSNLTRLDSDLPFGIMHTANN